MKMNHILKYYISFLSFFIFFQSYSNNLTEIDTLDKFGLRAGIDIHKLFRTISKNNYEGLSLNADLRISKKLFLFFEIGNEKINNESYYLNTTIKGNYMKAGIKNSLSKDIKGIENLIYVGFNFGLSSFEQTITQYIINNSYNAVWGEAIINEQIKLSNLNALWGEISIGAKTKVLKNLFLGIEVQLKSTFTQKNKDGITNLYMPGFNRTYDSSGIGAGFSYTISYLLPIIKK